MLNRTSRLCRTLAKATSGDGFRKITKQSLDMKKLDDVFARNRRPLFNRLTTCYNSKLLPPMPALGLHSIALAL